MSIYIKGMKKPKNCDECPIKACEDEWYVCPFSGVTTLSIGCQDSCPLVEIQPHGRLIDADDAVKVLVSLGGRDHRREKGTICEAIKMLSSAEYTPTIIPADKED